MTHDGEENVVCRAYLTESTEGGEGNGTMYWKGGEEEFVRLVHCGESLHHRWEAVG